MIRSLSREPSWLIGKRPGGPTIYSRWTRLPAPFLKGDVIAGKIISGGENKPRLPLVSNLEPGRIAPMSGTQNRPLEAWDEQEGTRRHDSGRDSADGLGFAAGPLDFASVNNFRSGVSAGHELQELRQTTEIATRDNHRSGRMRRHLSPRCLRRPRSCSIHPSRDCQQMLTNHCSRVSQCRSADLP
jgi:hypothetical protein